ncbi:hypothetical protein BJP34_35675 (plasmid) [Moorena producens PAL-8-15-08-1]|uniref:Uncharacterized protein n=1 Tax=Moorena producens PAL-8-15-08-1 TaxID=1458985 RepID=A0A1D8U495_9CYAN|nr:hypothetical protein BJP34_35675 [Moorena producens PAL-8-15-08-1]
MFKKFSAIALSSSIAISLLGLTPVKTLAQSSCSSSTSVCSVTVVEGDCAITTTLHSDGSVTRTEICVEFNEQDQQKEENIR